MTDFKPGDRVVYTGSFTTRAKGKTGTVVGLTKENVSVSWDEGVYLHHKPGDVWGVFPENITHIDVPTPTPTRNGWGWVEKADAKTCPEDVVGMPQHYRNHPSGVECITITQHMNFCRGNAIKYVWRAGEKGGKDKEIEDLRKARQYLDIEIKRLESAKNV